MLETLSIERRVTPCANQLCYVKAEMAGAGSYMIAVGHLVPGSLDVEKLRAASRSLVLRHDALRTRFDITDGAITALISPEPHFRFHTLPVVDPSLRAFRGVAVPLIFDRVDPRDPGSLVRIVAADHGECWRFTIAARHAITDGFSRGVMNKELLKIYAREELPPARSYYDFAATPSTTLSPEAKSLVSLLPSPIRLIGDSIGRGAADDAGQIPELS